ncbi:MAG: hypothetical protein US74_C0023G0017 [Parcubacteria group bacterium GW2011_GWA2_38_13]|nr:MAG: hypothetical protein US74_C0023G0017 [Parcubacteria group bacterium GW2011_GWA2_38_13]
MEFNKAIDIIRSLKDKEGLKIYDSHVHPFDVMGAMSPEIRLNDNNFELRPTLIDKLKFNRTANILMRSASIVAPRFIENSVKEIYKKCSPEILLNEMDNSYVDVATLVPVCPWVTIDEIYKYYRNDRYIYLGSIDIQSINEKDIESEIERQVTQYNIKGLKLHPNLQGFYPQPSHNDEIIESKLKKIYDIVSNKRLYILFHAGYTNLFSKNKSYRKKDYALLKNFIKNDGGSEIFENYSFPIVLAHLGNYAKIFKDRSIIELIMKRYSNIMFDTSGIDTPTIKWFLQNCGSTRLLFGSDAYYHNMKSSIGLCLECITRAVSKEKIEESISNIFCRNFEPLLRKSI